LKSEIVIWNRLFEQQNFRDDAVILEKWRVWNFRPKKNLK